MVLLVLACVLLLAACGKKGPPRPPLVQIPQAVTNFTAHRVGDDIELRWTVPVANADGSRPVTLRSMEVYALTLDEASDQSDPKFQRNFFKQAARVATIPAVQPSPRDEDSEEPAEPAPPPPPGAVEPGKDAIYHDTVPPASAVRVYMVVPISGHGRRGTLAAPVTVALAWPPPPVTGVTIQVTEAALQVSWPALVRPAVQAQGDASVAGLLPSMSITPLLPAGPLPSTPIPPPKPPYLYNIYRATLAGISDPAPINGAAPLADATFGDTQFEFGNERCYVVRTVDPSVTPAAESRGSAPACVTPKDTFPPAPPKNLVAVATERAINLLWEPNTEKDLAGYLVFRRDAPGAPPKALTPSPIHETTFHDATVVAGREYFYVVAAVDSATPPNMSGMSNEVRETTR